MNYTMMHGSTNIKFTEQVRCGLVLFCGIYALKEQVLRILGNIKIFNTGNLYYICQKYLV
jgi:hypothetical protein